MGKIDELFSLIPKGLKNFPAVVDGIRNEIKIELGTISDEDLEIITERRIICAECPFMSKNAEKLGLYKSSLDFEHCTQCGCPITTKTASLESNCGLEEYNKKHPENPLELKWTKTK